MNMIDGWGKRIIQSDEKNIFPYHRYSKDGVLYNQVKLSTGMEKADCGGWSIIKIPYNNKCMVPMDFNFSDWDFYTTTFPYENIDAHLTSLRDTIPQARFLREDEVNIIHKYFYNTRGRRLYTDFNYKEKTRGVLLFMLDTDRLDV